MAPLSLMVRFKVVTWDRAEKEMAPNAASGFRGIKIGCITMNVKYHVGGTEANSGVWMGGTVVKHLVDGEVSFLG